MIAAPSSPPPQLTGGARPLTLLVAPSKPLSQPLSRNYYCYATKNSVSYSQTRALPRLSLSIRPRRNNESLTLFRKQLWQSCLSAFSPPPQITTNNNNNNNNNNKSLFLSLALPDSYYDDGKSYIKEEEEEEEKIEAEKATASLSALQTEQKVAIEIPTYIKLVLGLAWKGQLLCIITKASIFAYFVLFTGLITSPIAFCGTVGGIISAYVSLVSDFNMCAFLHMVEEPQRIANDPLKVPLRADIMKHIKYTIPMNLFGIGATILGMQSRFGLESVFFSSQFWQYEDSNLIEACRRGLLRGSKGAVTCHLIGLASSLVLLRWITKPSSTNKDAIFAPAL